MGKSFVRVIWTESRDNQAQLSFSKKKKKKNLRSARTVSFLPPPGDPTKSKSQPSWEPKRGWSYMRLQEREAGLGL